MTTTSERTRETTDAAPLDGSAPSAPLLALEDASLAYGDRELWSHLDLEVRAGEFIAVLGANGSGKTSLLRIVLGQRPLSSGRARFLGRPLSHGDARIGYVPQQRLADDGTPLRARDLVGLGVDGRRWGPGLPSRARRERIDRALASVGAGHYGRAPLGSLSGGEQQRLRVGQALAAEPRLLLCDEPLLSLDLTSQRAVSELIDEQRRRLDLGVLFVTHDVNPVLPMVDRVLYLAGGRFRIGTPDEVLRSEVLTDLYGSPVEVVRAAGRVIVVGTSDAPHGHPDGSHAHHDEHHDPDHDRHPRGHAPAGRQAGGGR